jgi:hypothetical protein
LPKEGVAFSSLKFSFQQETFDSPRRYQNITAECQQRSEIQQLADALSTGTPFSTNCGGYSWRTFSCDNKVVFCVNCKQNCVNTVACPSASLILNPCSSCQLNAASGVTVQFQYIPIALFPSLLVTSVMAKQRQLVVSVKMSAPGIVYCNTFAPTYTLVTSRDIIDGGFSSVVWNTTLGNVTIEGLNPDSSYSLVCMTSDFQQHFMSLENSLLTKKLVNTACCRSIIATSSSSSIPQYVSTSGRTEPLFQFTLDSIPSVETRVTLSYFTSLCNGTILAPTSSVAAVPSSFRFYPNSSDFRISFVSRGTTTGCYSVVASTSGLQYVSASIAFSIVNVNLPPVVPKLMKVLFSNDLLRLLAVFNVATDQGSSRFTSATFNCSAMLLFPASTGATCSWLNSTTISASLSQIPLGGGPLPGDLITLRPNIIRAACELNTNCGSYGTSQRTTITISPADAPIFPLPSLLGPASSSLCTDLLLDPTGSKGAGYRPWSSVSWNVEGSTVVNNTNLQNYLNLNYPTTRFQATIPSIYLVPGTFRITLQISNFAGLASAMSTIVYISPLSGGFKPSILLVQSAKTSFRSQIFQVSSRVSLPTGCGLGNDTGTVTYAWRLYENFTYVPFVSNSAVPSVFRIPSYVLSPAVNYTLTLDVVVNVPFKGILQGSSSIFFVTGLSGISATITGGNSRDVLYSRSLVVDASTSYDLDYPPGDSAAQPLIYQWKCMVLAPLYGSVCSDVSAVLNGLASSTWTVPARSLSQTKYEITLTVKNRFGRLNTATQIWNVVNDAIPNVEISPPNIFYNPNAPFTITASVFAPQPNVSVQCTWSTSDASIANIVSSPVSRTISSGLSYFPLAIKPFRLVGGARYTFSFRAQYLSSTFTSSSSITITMNSPPFGGSLFVTPNEGRAMTSLFELTTADWTDSPSDYPLYYAFFYYASAGTDVMVVQTKDLFSYVKTVLGQGLNNQRYLVTCLVTCMDNFGGSANTTTQVTVTPPDNLGLVLTDIQLLLNKTATRKDVAANVLTRIIQTTLPSINIVDCNVPIPCGSLNRSACSTVSKTCGSCLVGTFGIDGSSNIPCSSNPLGIGASCRSNRACTTGRCEDGICVDAEKSCPSDCSNAGICRYVNKLNVTVSSCKVLDTTCFAVCRCRSGRFGQDCSLSSGRLVQNLAVKRQFCLSLAATYAEQDVTFDVIQARAVAVAQLLADPIQVADYDTFNACTNVLLKTVEDNAELACENSQGTFNAVMNAFNNIFYFLRTQTPENVKLWQNTQSLTGLGFYDPASWERNVTNTLISLSTGCISTLTVGQDALSIRTEDVRLHSMIDVGQFLTGSTITTPVSSYESVAQNSGSVVVNPSVSLVVGSEFSSTSLGISLIQRVYSDYDSNTGAMDLLPTNSTGTVTMNASSVIFGASFFGDVSLRRRRLLIGVNENVLINFTLFNKADVLYKNFSSSFVTLNCDDILPHSYLVDVICPGNFMFTTSCPAFKRGHINFTCPEVYQQPVCTYLQENTFQDGCRMIYFDERKTVCRCDLGELMTEMSSPRSLLSINELENNNYLVSEKEFNHHRFLQSMSSTSESIVVEVSARFDTVLTPTYSVFLESPAFLNVFSQYVVVSLSACITGLFIIFSTVLFRYETDEDRDYKHAKKATFNAFGLHKAADGYSLNKKGKSSNSSGGLFGGTQRNKVAIMGGETYQDDFYSIDDKNVNTLYPAAAVVLSAESVTPDYLSDLPPAIRSIKSFFNQMVPEVLSKRPWFLRFWRKLLMEHSFFRLISVEMSLNSHNSASENDLLQNTFLHSSHLSPPSSPMKDVAVQTATPTKCPGERNVANILPTRLFYASFVWCKFLLTVSITTIIFWLFYRDNEDRCPQISNRSDCLAETIIGNFGQSCQWEANNLSCQFRPPSLSATLVLLLTTVVLFVSTIVQCLLCRFFDLMGCVVQWWCLGWQSFRWFKRSHQTQHNKVKAGEMDERKDSREQYNSRSNKRSNGVKRKVIPSYLDDSKESDVSLILKKKMPTSMGPTLQQEPLDTTMMLRKQLHLHFLCNSYDSETLYQQDEFVRIVFDTPLTTKLRQGARFYQQQKTMDFALPKEEAMFLFATQQRYWDQCLRDRAVSDTLNNMWYHRLWYRLSLSSALSPSVGKVNIKVAMQRIQEARAKSLYYRQQLGEHNEHNWEIDPRSYRHRNDHLLDPNDDDDEDLIVLSETAHLTQQEFSLWKLIAHEEQQWSLANHDDLNQQAYDANNAEIIDSLYRLHHQMSRYHEQRRRERRLFRWFLLECFEHQRSLSATILKRCMWRRTDSTAMVSLRVLNPYYVNCASAHYAQTILHQQNDPHHNPHHNYLHAGLRMPPQHSLYAASVDEAPGQPPSQHNLPAMTLPEAKLLAQKAFCQVQYRSMMVVLVLTVLFSSGLFVMNYWLGSEIGSVSVGLWCIVFMVALVQELIVIETITIFARGIGVPAYVRRSFHHILYQLQRQAAVILMRSTGGHLRNANAFVQHLNPAVRAARFYPQYPVSRLLMNLSDIDLPLRDAAPPIFTLQSPPHYLFPYIAHHAYVWTRYVLEECCLHVVYLPTSIQDLVWRCYTILILQALAWALFWLYTVNLGALIFVTIVLVVVTIGLPLALLIRDLTASNRRRQNVNRRIFNTMDAASNTQPQQVAIPTKHDRDFDKTDRSSVLLNPFQLQVEVSHDETQGSVLENSMIEEDEFDENNMIIGDEDEKRSHKNRSAVLPRKPKRTAMKSPSVYLSSQSRRDVEGSDSLYGEAHLQQFAQRPTIVTPDFNRHDPLAAYHGIAHVDDDDMNDIDIQYDNSAGDNQLDVFDPHLPPVARKSGVQHGRQRPASSSAALPTASVGSLPHRPGSAMVPKVTGDPIPLNASNYSSNSNSMRPISAPMHMLPNLPTLQYRSPGLPPLRSQSAHPSATTMSGFRAPSPMSGISPGSHSSTQALSGPPLPFSDTRMAGPALQVEDTVDIDYIHYGYRFSDQAAHRPAGSTPGTPPTYATMSALDGLRPSSAVNYHAPVLDPDVPLAERSPSAGGLAGEARNTKLLEADPNPYARMAPSSSSTRPTSAAAMYLSTSAHPPSQRQMLRLQRSRTGRRPSQRSEASTYSQSSTEQQPLSSSTRQNTLYNSTLRQRLRKPSNPALYYAQTPHQQQPMQMQMPMQPSAGPGRDHTEQWEDAGPHAHLAMASAAARASVAQAQWLDEDPTGALAAHIINANLGILGPGGSLDHDEPGDVVVPGGAGAGEYTPGMMVSSRRALSAPPRSASRPLPSLQPGITTTSTTITPAAPQGPGSVLHLDDNIQKSLASQKRTFPMFSR